MPDPRFGIKIGNSTICLSQLKSLDVEPIIVPNKQGNRVTPACLLWDGDNVIECGVTAKQKSFKYPKQSICNGFQMLQSVDELTPEFIQRARPTFKCEYNAAKHVFQLTAVDSAGETVNLNVMEITAFDLHVKLLGEVYELAKELCENKDEPPIAILSVPSYYSMMSNQLLVSAAEKAGFFICQAVEETSASLLAVGFGERNYLENEDKIKHVLTIKCGGLFSYLVLYKIEYGYYIKLKMMGPFEFGGEQFTEMLMNHISAEFERKYGLNPKESRRSYAKIRTSAIESKHVLSTLAATDIYIESLMDGIDFKINLSRARFESLIKPSLSEFIKAFDDFILDDVPIVELVDAIVLVGGTSQIPLLQAMVTNRFPNAQLYANIAGDEVASLGCARQSMFVANIREQVLQTYEECCCILDDWYIWHGANKEEINSQRFLQRGDLLPQSFSITLKKNDDENSDNMVFQVRMCSNHREIVLLNPRTNVADDGYVHLQVEAVLPENGNVTLNFKVL